VSLSSTLKLAVKRGALVAAANWPVTVVQAVADALFKIIIAAPLVGGIFLVALVVGADPDSLFSLDWRELAATIVASLVSRPIVLVAFLGAVGVVAVGGSLFIFLVKGGTVGTLVRGEREAGPIEQPPLRLEVVARASVFSVEGFIASARALFPRYARLGVVLMAVYSISGLLYLATVFATRAGAGWGFAALLTATFVAFITIVNLLYLLMQIVIAADDCSVGAAATRVAQFIRRQRRTVAAVFLVVLGLVVFATGASFLATAALGFITFVPFFGLAILPLQLMAWVLRALVFQYIGLASIGAYVRLYRTSARDPLADRLPAAATYAPLEPADAGPHRSS
jgi:hypothetical protein